MKGNNTVYYVAFQSAFSAELSHRHIKILTERW